MSKKILVVDDEKDLAFLMVETLKTEGYEVISTTNAPQGLELAVKKHPDLIVLDVMMPVINGYNFCRLLKSQPQLKHIPVILVTSRIEDIDKQIGKEVGADAYITKPFASEVLLRKVKELVH